MPLGRLSTAYGMSNKIIIHLETDLADVVCPVDDDKAEVRLVDFGKHRGKPYSDVPLRYLKWMVSEGHSRSEQAREEVNRRCREHPDPYAEDDGGLDHFWWKGHSGVIF